MIKIEIVIIDTYDDRFGIKKEFPYPMEFIEETETSIKVKNKGVIEEIAKSSIKTTHKLFVKKKFT